MADSWLRCKVLPGQFTSEYAISGQQASGAGFSLFVPQHLVRTSAAPSLDSPAEGWLKVEVWEAQGVSNLVRLPRHTLETGSQFVTVLSAQLENGSTNSTAARDQ